MRFLVVQISFEDDMLTFYSPTKVNKIRETQAKSTRWNHGLSVSYLKSHHCSLMKSKKTGFCDYGAAIATLGEETVKAPLTKTS